MGNLRSVAKALEAAGAAVSVTSDAAQIDACDGLCVPGQGIFGRCMTNLARNGFETLIGDWIARERPYLGICLGMQVLFDRSEENNDVRGLGIIAGDVRRLPDTVTVPHIGWNTIGPTFLNTPTSGVGQLEKNGEYFYFDHSYAAFPADGSVVTAWCEHGERFAAVIETGSILGVQFHPEKSARPGINLLKGWLS